MSRLKQIRSRIRSAAAPRSLRIQLLSRSLLVLAVLLLLIGAFQYVIMKDFLYRNQAETMSSQSHGLPKDLFGIPGRVPEHWNLNNINSPDRRPLVFLPDMSIAYISENGEFIDWTGAAAGMVSPQLSADKYAALQEQFEQRVHGEYKVVQDKTGREQLVVFRPAGGPGAPAGLIQIGKDTAPLQSIVLRQLLIFITLSAIALACGLMLYLPLLRRTLHPLNRMVRTVEHINAGNLGIRFPSRQGQSEIDALAQSFNGMLERLEISFEGEREAKEQMRRFIADASHELRTPLTSIHGFLEVLLRGAAANPEHLQTSLKSMLGESTRMKMLVEDLLLLAKLDRQPVLELHETRLDSLISEMEPHLRMLAKQRTVRFVLTGGVKGMYDANAIKQVILNLFSNAVQHTDPEQGLVTATLTTTLKEAILSIRDNGCGIPPEHLPHVFDRFYRSDASRTRSQGGAGLGLAITQSIVEAHGGQIQVFSSSGEGTTFKVSLPLNRPS
ncbi:sensor histidine kinase [Paenibacillus lentus]|uniref:histidine kinase n=1 Tax=Paenibacillus lentus TaxID=1338368 RepID=A0A3Q8SAH8_9BACL|nr:HAMP domain-containing sensor histidine kinase [Paenibacillus lentus]AZK46125.1 sensor histidine kinase [Paenibacillus lentus]